MLHLFDLDHTLVHSLTLPLPGHNSFRIRVNGNTYFVHVRPHVIDFLKFLHERKVPWGIWTAGTEDYMNEVVSGLFLMAKIPLHTNEMKVCLTRKHTTYVNNTYVKDLSYFGKIDVILYDDDMVHQNWPKNKGRIVTVPAYDVTKKGSKRDCFFLTLRCENDAKTLSVR